MSSLHPGDRILIYLASVFTEKFPSLTTIHDHAELLKKYACTKLLQRKLLAGFEWLCGRCFPQLNQSVSFSKVLMQLYEEEIVEEDVFFDWSLDICRNEYTVYQSMIDLETLESLREHATPFMTWLQEAEEEGEDDEEEDDDEEA
jgi:translation initiation factor 5